MINSQDELTKEKILHIYQYVLGNKVGIVRGELYEYFILRVLYDHAQNSSLIKEEIKKHIENDYNLTCIPDVHLESAYVNLQNKKFVIGTEKFSLSSDKITEIKQNNEEFIDYMKKVLDELNSEIKEKIPDIENSLRQLTVKNVYKLLGKTFTIHGKVAAKLVIDNKGSIKELKNYSGFKRDYEEIVLKNIPTHLRAKIDDLFNEFFFEPTLERSKFFYAMAQSHTLLEILNVDHDLKQIQLDALKQTKIFLDTNVIIYLLFAEGRQSSAIRTVIGHILQLGASLYINKITKKEFENWLESKKREIPKIRSIPEKLSEALFSKKIDAPLFTGYMKSLRKHPRQTVDQFCLQFSDISKTLEENYKILLDDEDISDLNEHELFEKLENVISKNIAKSSNVVAHDALCILKVKEYRKNNPSNSLGPKAWFLTTDDSLARVERKVFDEDEIRASITSTLFLQILSPIISPELKTDDVTKGFSKLLSVNFGRDNIIDQEDILNISSAFYNIPNLEPDELSALLGDKTTRNSLKKIRLAHLKKDIEEEKKWTNISISNATKILKGKHELEIESYKESLEQFVSQIDNKDQLLDIKNKKIKEQSETIKNQSKKLESYDDKELEKKWNRKFLIRLFIGIGIVITIPTSLYLTSIVTETSDVISILSIEIPVLVGMFVSWIIYHHTKSKKSK